MNQTIPAKERRREPIGRVVIAAVLASALLFAAAPPILPSWGEDSVQYWYMARGRWDLVIQPFSFRFLHARLVGAIGRSLGLQIDTVFLMVAVVSLLVGMLLVAVLLRRLGGRILLMVPAVFGFASLQTFRLVYMPDQFYTMLLAALLLLLCLEQLWAVVPAVVLLFCARESTLVLAVVMIAVIAAGHFRRTDVVAAPGNSLVRRKPLLSAAVLTVAMLAGMLINRRVGRSAPNFHDISPMAYLLGKPPYNFCKNVLGVEPWTNTLFRSLGTSPIVRFDLPARLRLGRITQIGIADISIRYPAHWILSSLTTFGVLLTVVAFNLKARSGEGSGAPSADRRRFWRRWARWVGESALAEQYRAGSLVWRIALIYGALNLLIAPLLGTAVHRYVYYAWPAFWIVGLDLLGRFISTGLGARPRQYLLGLLLIHLMLLWTAVFEEPIYGEHPWLVAAMALAAVILHAIAWRLIARLVAGHVVRDGDLRGVVA